MLPNGGGNCSAPTDCGGFGHCLNNTCYCPQANTGLTCDYGRKSETTAFLLDFFLGFTGAGQFYLGRKSIALGILLTMLFGMIVVPVPIVCVGMCHVNNAYRKQSTTLLENTYLRKKERRGKCLTMFAGIQAGIVGLIVLTWWTINWIMIVAGKSNDGNGERLNMDM